MFPKLTRRIYLSIFVIPSLFLLTISSLTIVFTNNYLRENYSSTTASAVNMAKTNFSFHLSLMAEDVALVSEDQAVISFAKDGSSIEKTQEKLSILTSSSGLLGVAAYSLNVPTQIASNGVSGYSSLSALLEDGRLEDFIDNDEAAYFFWIRFTNIPDNYIFLSYDDSYGVLSIVVKIYEDDQVQGIIVADVNSETIYRDYFNFNSYRSINPLASFIISDDQYLRYSGNEDYAQRYNLNSDYSQLVALKGGYHQYRATLIEDYDFYLITSDSYYNNANLILFLSVGIINIGLITLAFILAQRMVKKLVSPLDLLVDKIKTQKL